MADVLQVDIGVVGRDDDDDFVLVDVAKIDGGDRNSDGIELSSAATAKAAVLNGLRESIRNAAPDAENIVNTFEQSSQQTLGRRLVSCRSASVVQSSSPPPPPTSHPNGHLREKRPEAGNPDRKNKRASSEDMPNHEIADTVSSAVPVSTSVNRCAPSCSAPPATGAKTTTLHSSNVQRNDASKIHDVSSANAVPVEPENVSDDDDEEDNNDSDDDDDDDEDDNDGDNDDDDVDNDEKLSGGDEHVSRNRLPNNNLENEDEGFKEQDDEEEDDEEEVEEDEDDDDDIDQEQKSVVKKDNLIVLEPGVLIENDEETEELSGDGDPVDIPQPFSDELDSLGSVEADNDILGSRNVDDQNNCADDLQQKDDVLRKSDIILKSDGEMEDFVDGPAVGVSSGCVSSRSSNSSSGDVEIEDLAVSEEGDLSPKSSKDKSVMKRKQFVDSKNHCLGKKRCFSNSMEGVTDSEETCPDLSAPLPAALAQIHALKKRIPTKENPPPELAKWLDTFQFWSNAERMLALDQMIDLCDPTQVRHMMSVIEPQFQRDFISLLPKELALYVLSFLEPKDLLRAAQTCKYWRILAEDNLLWREKCREAEIDEVRDILQRRRSKSCCVVPSPWKAAYMRQHDIEMNWRFRPIRSPKVLKGHDDHVITCLQFSGSRIVSGSDDNTLKVWSATTGKCLKTLVGHTGGVWSSQMSGSIIVSGSTDRTLKVWNADSGQCIHTLYGHTSTVRCMHLHGNRVVSGSRDSTLRLWDIGTGMCQHVLLGHVAAVRCVQYGPDGRLVVSGAYDYTVKVWNPEREECLHTLQGHTNRVYSLQFDGVHVVSGSLDTSIRVWDVESGACRHTLMGHQSLTSGMELKNNILVSGNADSTVKVWDIMTGQCLQTLSGPNKHNSAVTCLQFNSKFVITSSDDGTVKLWDLKTGEFVRNLVALESGGSGGVVWRIRASPTKLVCAVGSRNGTEETKLLVLDFDALAEVQKVEVK